MRDEDPSVSMFLALIVVGAHYAVLCTLAFWTLRAFVWQPSFLVVVQYIYGWFPVRALALNPCVAVPSNHDQFQMAGRK